MKPMKSCKHPGCAKLTNSNYCVEHEVTHRGERLGAAARGYDSRWRKARSRFLNANPLCIRCKGDGKFVKAKVVDHIIPHRGDKILFWDENNWQALCKTCHDRKTMTEDKYCSCVYKL